MIQVKVIPTKDAKVFNKFISEEYPRTNPDKIRITPDGFVVFYETHGTPEEEDLLSLEGDIFAYRARILEYKKQVAENKLILAKLEKHQVGYANAETTVAASQRMLDLEEIRLEACLGLMKEIKASIKK